MRVRARVCMYVDAQIYYFIAQNKLSQMLYFQESAGSNGTSRFLKPPEVKVGTSKWTINNHYINECMSLCNAFDLLS